MPRKHPKTQEEKERYRIGQKNAKGRLICGAQTRGGKPCPVTIIYGNGRCRVHGGPSPIGPVSATFVTGRHSKFMPQQLRERYEQALADPEIDSLRGEIALVDSRIFGLIESLGKDGTGNRWQALSKEYAKLNEARAITDAVEKAEAIAAHLNEIGKIIRGGVNESEAWAEIVAIVEQRRKLAEGERKRLVDLNQMITTEQALIFMNAVADIVRTHVTDSEVMGKISRDLIRLSAARAGRTIDAPAIDTV